MVNRVKSIVNDEGWLSLLGYILSFHAVALGLSFALDTADAQRTLLYQSIVNFPVVTPVVFGWILAGSGFVAFLGYFTKVNKTTKNVVKYASYIQFFVYLFMIFLYAFHGLFWYAASVAVPWAPLIYLVSKAYYRLQPPKTLEEQRIEWGLK